MKDYPQKGKGKAKLSRRDFLKAGAAGLGVAALGGLPEKVFGQAPAKIKGTSLSILQGSYFIAPGQDLYKKQAQEWGQANGVTMSADFLNWPDLQPKIAASIQAGGYDIVELWPGWNYLYQNNLVDVHDMAEEFGKRGGGFEKYVLVSGKVNGRWLGMPHGYSNASMAYRISWFKEAGCPNAEDGNKVDLTWDEYFAIAKKLKAKGKPFGQSLGQSTGDPPGFCYPYMWAHGGMEVEKDGKTIAFNKPQFVDGMKKFIQAWKDGYDETGTSWDDSNNNRAYLSEQISSTFNGSSIYFAAKKDKPKLAEDTHHILIPKGPSGRFYWLETRTFAILKTSKNISAAKEFLKWWFQDKQFGDWWRLQEGYMLQPVVKYYNDPTWLKDPKMLPFREQPKYGLNLGYAGPDNEKAAMAWSKYLVVNTFAKAVQGGDAKKAIEWGAEQLKRTYGR
ncbi:MAG: putative sugar uptake transporter periplasmic solute-binding protein precursor [Deltaproteobacteria bacterium]|nr:putative sugar uptake transporter periplasmic solute-binding protein precursor [Deltaproteobacteria bacterium]